MRIVLTEEQYNKIVSEEMDIDEVRSSHLTYITQKVKELTGQEWPEYVLRDWIYKNTKNFNPEMETTTGYKKMVYRLVRDFIGEYGNGHWEFKKIDISVESFTPDTQKYLTRRNKGSVEVDGVPNDIERHQTQKSLLKQRGMSSEPIIVIQKPDGYELLEGWHRTVQNLSEYGSYVQPAFIYVPK